MADKHQVVFYPVGNGDTTQIVLSDGRRILLDFCQRVKSEDTMIPEIDLAARLKADLKKVNKDYFDVVAFTHADLDHIQGSTDFFELRHAQKYQGSDRIKIEELWVPAAMLLEKTDNDHQKDEFVLLRQEARHRLLEGKGILVFSKPKELIDWLEPYLKKRDEPASARDHLFVDAGTIVPGFSLGADKVEFFCHSPFIKHCDDGDIIRNEASLVFNIRFRAGSEEYDYLHFGDATWESVEDIVSTTLYHNNDDRLVWDLYNVPHHCSYLALSDKKGEKETEPKPRVKELLGMGKRDAYIVSSSKPITNTDTSYEQKQPPHIQARKAYEKYLKKVGGREFLVTMEEPNTDKPDQILFEITRAGVTWIRPVSSGATFIVQSSPPRAG